MREKEEGEEKFTSWGEKGFVGVWAASWDL
jgi:hypothetical protein